MLGVLRAVQQPGCQQLHDHSLRLLLTLHDTAQYMKVTRMGNHSRLNVSPTGVSSHHEHLSKMHWLNHNNTLMPHALHDQCPALTHQAVVKDTALNQQAHESTCAPAVWQVWRMHGFGMNSRMHAACRSKPCVA